MPQQALLPEQALLEHACRPVLALKLRVQWSEVWMLRCLLPGLQAARLHWEAVAYPLLSHQLLRSGKLQAQQAPPDQAAALPVLQSLLR